MRLRDRNYIEDRLLAPTLAVTEAVERLRQIQPSVGEDPGAAERRRQVIAALTAAEAELHDACAAARRMLFYPRQQGQMEIDE